jgi:hypothetical protein
MKHNYSDLALDKDGIPILTDLVPEDKLENASRDNAAPPPPPPPPIFTPEDIARKLLSSDMVQQQLDQIANDLAHDMRLRIEQTLAESIDQAINRTLDNHTAHTAENIRQELILALPRLMARALEDADPDD